MRPHLRAFLAGVLVASLGTAGCASFAPLERSDAQAIRQQIEVGDDVRVAVKDGRVFEFEVTSLDDTEMRGAQGRSTYRIAYSQVTAIERKETHVVASILGGIGITVGVAVAVLAIALHNADFHLEPFCGD